MNYRRSIPTESTSLHQSDSSHKKKCCSGNSDGFTIISMCFFVVTATVTFALLVQIYYGNPEVMPHGAVATDDSTCSKIGLMTMRKGGSAVDVAISSLMCLSVTHPHIAGAGGGGVMLVYDHKKNDSKIFDFMSSFPASSDNSGGSIGVPGFLKGLEVVHKKFGLLKWKELIFPAVKLAKTGFRVSDQLAQAIAKEGASQVHKSLNPKSSSIVEGTTLRRPLYAHFLEDVAQNGADAFYLMKYGMEFLEARDSQSLINIEDFQNYKVIERPAIKANFYNMTISTAGPPFAGRQVIAGLRALEGWGIDPKTQTNSFFDALIKAVQLGSVWIPNAVDYLTYSTVSNPNVPELPAAQVVAVDAFDLYVSAVVGLGSNFGSNIITEHQIILNDQLGVSSPFKDEQSTRPLMPFTPVMVTNSKNICGNRLSLSSGSYSAVLQVLTQFILMGHDMTTSIAQPRIALGKDIKTILVNDLDSSRIRLSGEIRQHLKDENYTIGLLYSPLSVNGIQKLKDRIVSHSDTRGGGVAARLDGLHGEDSEAKVISSSVPSNVATYVVPKDDDDSTNDRNHQ